MKQEEGKEKKSIPRRIFNICGYVLIGLIVFALLFVLLSKVTNRIPFIFGKSVAWVMTDSMEPTIPEQSYILISKADVSKIGVGDVIMFISSDPKLEGNKNTHRVVEIIGDKDAPEFVTKGDASSVNDSYTVKAENVVAVYEKNLPALTAVGRFMFSGIGMMMSVTAIMIITLLLFLPEIKKSSKEWSAEIEKRRREQIDELVKAEVERMKAEDAEKAEANIINAESGDKADNGAS